MTTVNIIGNVKKFNAQFIIIMIHCEKSEKKKEVIITLTIITMPMKKQLLEKNKHIFMQL